MKNNKEKEIEEQTIRAKLFQARLQAAKENSEKFHKTKADEKHKRAQEKSQFSPLNTRPGKAEGLGKTHSGGFGAAAP